MRIAPAVASTRRVTMALRPTSASVPVRESAGMRTWRRAIGRRNASDAIEPAMKTTSAPDRAGAEQVGDRRRTRGERDRAEEEQPRASSISPTASATANSDPHEPAHDDER